MKAARQKVIFELQPDEDGYPPVSFEGLWGTPLPNGNLTLDSGDRPNSGGCDT